jgi:hypothetical protein
MNYAWSADIIKIYSPYSAGHSATPAMRKIVDTANDSQSIYRFVLEFKPGGNQVIAVKSIESENSLAIIAPAFVENVASGQLDQKNYVPVHALGDACWAVIANKPLKGAKEFTVGGVGFGNAAHLTALALGEKYGFKVRYVVFKSNYDALVNMTGNNGVELVIDKYEGYQALRTQNPRLQMIAASCPQRLPQEPQIKTLKEMGITAPYIFNIAVAHRDMDSTRRQAIGNILNQATEKLGATEIYRLSAMRPPMFDRIGTEQFYSTSTALVRQLQEKYKDQINSQR